MSKKIEFITAIVQIFFAIDFVAFALFNLVRTLMGWYNASIIIMFVALVGATSWLLVLSINDYRKMRKEMKQSQNVEL